MLRVEAEGEDVRVELEEDALRDDDETAERDVVVVAPDALTVRVLVFALPLVLTREVTVVDGATVAVRDVAEEDVRVGVVAVVRVDVDAAGAVVRVVADVVPEVREDELVEVVAVRDDVLVAEVFVRVAVAVVADEEGDEVRVVVEVPDVRVLDAVEVVAARESEAVPVLAVLDAGADAEVVEVVLVVVDVEPLTPAALREEAPVPDVRVDAPVSVVATMEISRVLFLPELRTENDS